MFLSSYNRLCCLHLFPALKRLQVIGQGIESIQGLETCQSLESLWIVEADLTSVSGLEVLTGLTKLYLYGNAISRISNLQHLHKLQVLWLADNHISELTGLATLTFLQELNVARNPIHSVPHCLCLNTSLRTLNLADTAITSFTALSPLAVLPSLRELFLDDPSWGRAPIAELANYQTMVIVQLPQLTVLDYLLISDDASDLAQSTFAKKRMFYNMRTKGCMRIMHEAEELARGGLWAQQHAWHAQIEEAVRVRIRLEYMIRHHQEMGQHEQEAPQLLQQRNNSTLLHLNVPEAAAKLRSLRLLERSVAAHCCDLQVRLCPRFNAVCMLYAARGLACVRWTYRRNSTVSGNKSGAAPILIFVLLCWNCKVQATFGLKKPQMIAHGMPHAVICYTLALTQVLRKSPLDVTSSK